MRRRKKKPLKAAAGPRFYDPDRDATAVQSNCRNYFLSAVESVTPEVLRYLHNEVWPKYNSAYWAEHGFGKAPLDRLNCESIVSSALAPQPDKDNLPEMTLALNEWAKRFHLMGDWTLRAALNVMHEWSIAGGPAHGEMIRAMLKDADIVEPVSWERDIRVYHWSHGLTWANVPEGCFQFQGYAGHDPEQYRRARLAEFETHLSQYLKAALRKQPESSALPSGSQVTRWAITPSYRFSDFELLALYICRNWSAARIDSWLSEQGRDEAKLQERTLVRRLHPVAKSVGLTLRPRGRRAPTQ